MAWQEAMQNSDSPHIEPEEVFLPLSIARYAEFYALEMNEFTEDILFYQNNIPPESTILELGCGTGRISRSLSKTAKSVTGLDLSQEMLKLASCNSNSPVNYVCMDMCEMAFLQTFDFILIPYNTLNLLQTESQIIACLRQVHKLLQTDGILLFQIYVVPDKPMHQENNENIFQFQMFPLPNNKGKLIKETIRSLSSQTATVQLEERYRIRGNLQYPVKLDYKHTLLLAAFSLKKWIQLLNKAHFQIISLADDYHNRSSNKDTSPLLLVKAKKN